MKGEGNSAPITLSGGRLSGGLSTDGNCYYGLDLERTSGRGSETLFSADKRTSGTQYLYDLRAGEYFVRQSPARRRAVLGK